LGKRGPDLRDAEDVDEELGQVVDARDEPVDRGREPGIPGRGREQRVVVADHAGARGRRRDDRVVVREHVGEAADQRDALGAKAGVEVHLPAARLALGKLDVLAEAPEQTYGCPADLGEQEVVEAGDEQGDLHALMMPTFPAGRGSYRRTSAARRT